MQETIYHLNTQLNIALVADSHNQPPEPILASLRSHLPDIICIPGDFIHARLPEEGLKMEQSENAMALLNGCSSIAPTFLSFGNHEWMLNDQDKDMIRSTGVTMLDNSYIRYPSAQGKVDRDILIGGLSSGHYLAYQDYCKIYYKEYCKASPCGDLYLSMRPKDARIRNHEPQLDWLDEFCSRPGYKILLSHHPEYYPSYLKSRPIDLILSGHAHGGQIRILGQGLYAPGQGLLPALTSGVKDGRLVISRGLANNTVIPRVFNEEEIVYITSSF